MILAMCWMKQSPKIFPRSFAFFTTSRKAYFEAPDFRCYRFLEVSEFPSDKNLFWILKISESYCNYIHEARNEAQGRTRINETLSGYETMGIPFVLGEESLRRCASTIFAFCFMITLCLMNSSSMFTSLIRSTSLLLPRTWFNSCFPGFRRPCGITESFRMLRANYPWEIQAQPFQHMDFPDVLSFALDFSSHRLEKQNL